MATAKLEISYQVGGRFDGGGSVQTMTCVVEMVYNYLSANSWTESIGRLGDKSGDWTVLGKTTVMFHDSKSNSVAQLDNVPITSSFGYPLSGLKGKSGTGWFLIGMSTMRGFDWKFIDV